MRSSTPCCRSVCLRCSSATLRASSSIWPRSLRVVGALRLDLLLSSSRLRLSWSICCRHLRHLLVLARARLLVALLELLAQVEDGAARLVVVEQAGARRRGAGERQRSATQRGRGSAEPREARHVQRLASSARRFFAHASSFSPCTAGRSLPRPRALKC